MASLFFYWLQFISFTFCISLYLAKFSMHYYLLNSYIYSLDYYGVCPSFCNALLLAWNIFLCNSKTEIMLLERFYWWELYLGEDERDRHHEFVIAIVDKVWKFFNVTNGNQQILLKLFFWWICIESTIKWTAKKMTKIIIYKDFDGNQ